MNQTDNWKVLVLQRYAGEFPPHSDAGTPIKKSSEDIAFDLQGMGDFSADEVSVFMAELAIKANKSAEENAEMKRIITTVLITANQLHPIVPPV
jgi:hypothetical protein